MNNWLWLIAYLPLTFLLHNCLHEFAHCVACWMHGVKVTRFWPFPGWGAGRFTFAYMAHEPIGNKDTLTAVLIAPVWLEMGWCVAALVGVWLSLAFGSMIGLTVAVVEALAALIDIGNWFAGALLHRKNLL